MLYGKTHFGLNFIFTINYTNNTLRKTKKMSRRHIGNFARLLRNFYQSNPSKTIHILNQRVELYKMAPERHLYDKK